jgi:photosystem II stability/assembly factor-like uncharacterized protein
MKQRGTEVSRRHVLATALAVPFATARCGGASPGSPSGQASPTPVPAATPPDIGPSGWALQTASPTSPNQNRHDDIFFIDRQNGWLVNPRAEVWATQNGGQDWQQVAKLDSDVFLRCVGFASPSNGWAGNLNRTGGAPSPDYSLFETLDGGRTWANISSRIQGAAVVGLCGMRLPAPDTIVAAGRWNGPAVFVKSTDGGRTFTSTSLSPLLTGAIDVSFFDSQRGFVVGGQGVGSSIEEQRSSRTVILATTDGGQTWQTRYSSAAIGQWAWKIQFVDSEVGYVTTEGPNPEGVILKTTDGGLTWRPLLVRSGVSFEGVGFVSRDLGWAGSFPSLFQTTDGGATWSRLGFGAYVNRLRVMGPDLVYAAGDRVYRWTV